MKTKRENEDFETAFEKPFDFSKGVPNPYVNHSREAWKREAAGQAAAGKHSVAKTKQTRVTR